MNTEPEEMTASIENRDPLENTSTRASKIIVVNPFEFCGPISNGMEMDPQVIEDKYEEISSQEFKSKKKNTMEKYTASIYEGKKVFKCNMCAKNFGSNGNLNEHIASVHEGIKSFKCEVCDNRFSRKSHLSGGF